MRECFSQTEQKVINHLKRKSKSIKQLSDLVYKDNAPMYATSVISSCIKRINIKCIKNNLDFRLLIVGSAGPSGKTITYSIF
jgi:hypothetical protein